MIIIIVSINSMKVITVINYIYIVIESANVVLAHISEIDSLRWQREIKPIL